MLDISLTASLLDAIPKNSQLVLIGDADQLPSVGAGNVLGDLIASGVVPTFSLNTIFRQAKESQIVHYAHSINNGKIPHIPSPFNAPELWKEHCDCLFIDSNEATQHQLQTIRMAKEQLKDSQLNISYNDSMLYGDSSPKEDISKQTQAPGDARYAHVDFKLLETAENNADELRSVLNKTHPWSSLHFGLTAGQVMLRLYDEWIPKYFGNSAEIQILSPMTRGSLGTAQMNKTIQHATNPSNESKGEIRLGDRIYRVGDRVIHRKNNSRLFTSLYRKFLHLQTGPFRFL